MRTRHRSCGGWPGSFGGRIFVFRAFNLRLLKLARYWRNRKSRGCGYWLYGADSSVVGGGGKKDIWCVWIGGAFGGDVIGVMRWCDALLRCYLVEVRM